MKSNDTKIPRFKIYKHEDEYCAETMKGIWRLLEFIDNAINIYESDKKPEEFKEFVLMTEQEIDDNELYDLYRDYFEVKTLFVDVNTLSAAVKVFKSRAEYIEELVNRGWEFTSNFDGPYREMRLELKPHDFIDSPKKNK